MDLCDQREFKRYCGRETACTLGLFITFFLFLLCLLWECGEERQVDVEEGPAGRKTPQFTLIFTFVEKKRTSKSQLSAGAQQHAKPRG